MKNVYRNNNNRWTVRIMFRGKRTSKDFATKAAAEAYAKELQAKIQEIKDNIPEVFE